MFKVYLKEGNLDAANAILLEIIQIDSNKDVKELKADLDVAKNNRTNNVAPTSLNTINNNENQNLSIETAQSDYVQRMHEIVFSPKTIEDIKSKGYPPGSVASNKLCYFDSSKNIAYEGMLNVNGEPENANVIRIHNPKIIPYSEVPLAVVVKIVVAFDQKCFITLMCNSQRWLEVTKRSALARRNFYDLRIKKSLRSFSFSTCSVVPVIPASISSA